MGFDGYSVYEYINAFVVHSFHSTRGSGYNSSIVIR